MRTAGGRLYWFNFAGGIIKSLNCTFHLTVRSLKKYKLAKLGSLGNNNKNLVNNQSDSLQ